MCVSWKVLPVVKCLWAKFNCLYIFRSLVIWGVFRDAVDRSFIGVDEASMNPTCHLQLTLDPDATGGHCLAGGIGRLAHVGARVFRVGVQDVQRHEAEVIGCAETMAWRRVINRNATRCFYILNTAVYMWLVHTLNSNSLSNCTTWFEQFGLSMWLVSLMVCTQCKVQLDYTNH